MIPAALVKTKLSPELMVKLVCHAVDAFKFIQGKVGEKLIVEDKKPADRYALLVKSADAAVVLCT